MKIIAICGSPRGKKSQTRVLAEALLEGAKAKGAEVQSVDLSKARIGFCQACEACHRGPDCVLHDDGHQILDQVLAADGIVFATPVYLNQVTAQLKAILDRTSHFVHCQRLLGKYTASVSTSGGGGGGDVVAFLKSYSLMVGAQFVDGIDARAPLTDANFSSARELGGALVAAIKEGKAYPEQMRTIGERRKYFAQLIAARKDHWPYEYEYWREKGWL